MQSISGQVTHIQLGQYGYVQVTITPTVALPTTATGPLPGVGMQQAVMVPMLAADVPPLGTIIEVSFRVIA